ncbi:MAG TPA: DUF2784 domain-containing protein [Acidimicrobiales bacterium]|jgi:hypothetical protein
MGYGLLADAVVIVHLGFILFVALGGLLAWRWPRLVWAHVPAVVYAVAILTVGFTYPLTPLEKLLRRLGDAGAYDGGFVDRYVEGVVYPESLAAPLRAVAAAAVVAGYAGLAVRAERRRDEHAAAGPAGR